MVLMGPTLSILEHHRLGLTLRPVFIGQVILLETFSHPAYGYKDGEFVLALEEDEAITSDFISNYAKNLGKNIYINTEDFERMSEKTRGEITKLSRALSIGNAKKNATKHANLLSMQMETLYNNPFSDEILNNQFQSTKNLSGLLLNHRDLHKDLYHTMSKSNYHYTITQPLLSSIMLLSFFQTIGGFSDKEIQNLFLTSYFKDIGMSLIPREVFEKTNLTEFDMNLFAEHSQNSMQILNNRIPLSDSYLNMIKNHHFLNNKIQMMINGQTSSGSNEFMTGIESSMLSSLDILVAMTHERPYRSATSVFVALELLKKVLSDEYPQEFKALVIFLKKFYSL